MTEFKFYNWLDLGTKDKNQKETEIWIEHEKDGFKPSLRLDWKVVETF